MNADARTLREVVHAVGAAVRRDEQHLCDLDAAVGDGDHGLTMVRCWDLVEREADRDDAVSASEVLERAGRAVVAAGGGATGPLLGTALIAAGRAAGDSSADPSVRIAGMLAAAVDEVERRGRARAGDRTMLDALRPAAEAARRAADAGAAAADVVSAAADAAEMGARATADMVARIGRATRLGDRAIGHPDPGAVSVAIVLRAAADRLATLAATEPETA